MAIWTNLNDTTPAAPAGKRNTKWQVTATYIDAQGRTVRDASSNEPSTGLCNDQTAGYVLQASDCGKMVIHVSSSAHTFTLPNPPPFADWTAYLINRGSGLLSVDANGLLLDGAATSPLLVLNPGEGILVHVDGANYSSWAGGGGAGGGEIDEALTVNSTMPFITVDGLYPSYDERITVDGVE